MSTARQVSCHPPTHTHIIESMHADMDMAIARHERCIFARYARIAIATTSDAELHAPSDQYIHFTGAAVLAHSLRDCGTTKKLACLVVQDGLLASTIEELQSLYNYVIPIERIGNPQPQNLYLMNRPDLLYTFTKINLWRQVQFRKVVYIDADVVALRAPEELFDIPDTFAAAPDVGWPDAFNSGVMVLTPDMGEYHALRGLANSGDSFDGADQGLLNQYYEHRPWKRLSFTYNTTPSANYQYEPAYRYWKRDITLVHFIGKDKPWQRARQEKGAPKAFQEMLSRWWAVYDRHFRVSVSRKPGKSVNATEQCNSLQNTSLDEGTQLRIRSRTRVCKQTSLIVPLATQWRQPSPHHRLNHSHRKASLTTRRIKSTSNNNISSSSHHTMTHTTTQSASHTIMQAQQHRLLPNAGSLRRTLTKAASTLPQLWNNAGSPHLIWNGMPLVGHRLLMRDQRQQISQHRLTSSILIQHPSDLQLRTPSRQPTCTIKSRRHISRQ